MKQTLALYIIALILGYPAAGGTHEKEKAKAKGGEITESGPGILWQDPDDLSTRDLFYGSGGKADQPHGQLTFIKEDLNGTSPKFDAKDQDGVKWKVKLGVEARPETVASRFVWAAGYFTTEDYFLPELRVAGMPPHLRRGQNQVSADGMVVNARLKRAEDHEEKIGIWSWRSDPFTGTREWNGLRVLMALINNWDLKDSNNAVYRQKDSGPDTPLIYLASDLGASFGADGRNWPAWKAKGNIEAYSRSKFIGKVTADYVDFKVPGRPALICLADPHSFIHRMRMRWIGKDIPRSDARWMGQLLAKLSPDQIQDAFRAGGYTPQEVEAFSRIVEDRIAELKAL
jgi:hypothetical protein